MSMTTALEESEPQVILQTGDRDVLSRRTLQDVGKIVTGSTPPKAQTHLYGGSFPFVKPGELLNCRVSTAEDNLSDAGSKVADTAPEGAVLVSCIGNLGKVGLAARSVAFNQQINAIIPHDKNLGAMGVLCCTSSQLSRAAAVSGLSHDNFHR